MLFFPCLSIPLVVIFFRLCHISAWKTNFSYNFLSFALDFPYSGTREGYTLKNIPQRNVLSFSSAGLLLLYFWVVVFLLLFQNSLQLPTEVDMTYVVLQFYGFSNFRWMCRKAANRKWNKHLNETSIVICDYNKITTTTTTISGKRAEETKGRRESEQQQ